MVEVNIHFDFAVSGTVLAVCCCDNNLAHGYDIEHLAWYGKGCIVDLRLFQIKQSTHDIFFHFPQKSYYCREALCHQTDHHPSFLHLSLVLGYLQVVGSNHLGVLLIVVRCCCIC